jgi:hypothetical protein
MRCAARSSRWRIILPAFFSPPPGDGKAALDLSTRTILYVGGRPNQIPQLKALVERTGARFLHHDGGIEHSSSLLPGLISRADVLLFPIDCISHDAVATLKRLCRQLSRCERQASRHWRRRSRGSIGVPRSPRSAHLAKRRSRVGLCEGVIGRCRCGDTARSNPGDVRYSRSATTAGAG